MTLVNACICFVFILSVLAKDPENVPKQVAKSDSCAINISQVTANVQITCTGIPHSALIQLERMLTDSRASEKEVRNQVNSWHTKYDDLFRSLGDAHLAQALNLRAQQLLASGDLDGAAHLFDEALDQESTTVTQIATLQLLRGQLAQLQFNIPLALIHYRNASSLAPNNVVIAFIYGNLLLSTGSYSKAAYIFEVLLKTPSLPAGDEALAATLLNAGSAFQRTSRTLEAEEAYSKAESLFHSVTGTGEHAARRNEAVAHAARANMVYDQGDHLRACEMLGESVTLVRINVERSGEGTNQLAGALDEYASCKQSTGDNPGALDVISESITLWRSPLALISIVGDNSQFMVASGLAGALATKAIILGQNGDAEGALSIAKEEIEAIQIPANKEPDVFGTKLAHAYSVEGVALVFLKKPEEAQEAFTKSVALYKMLALSVRSDILPEYARTLNYLAATEMQLNHRDPAIKAANQSIDLLVKIKTDTDNKLLLEKQCIDNASAIYTTFGELKRLEDLKSLKQQLKMTHQPDL